MAFIPVLCVDLMFQNSRRYDTRATITPWVTVGGGTLVSTLCGAGIHPIELFPSPFKNYCMEKLSSRKENK